MCFRTGRKIFQGAGSEQGRKSNALEGERDGFFDGPAYLTHHRMKNTPLLLERDPPTFEVIHVFVNSFGFTRSINHSTKIADCKETKSILNRPIYVGYFCVEQGLNP